jgi:CubicO group peptidase (beta-lactamase class C family)
MMKLGWCALCALLAMGVARADDSPALQTARRHFFDSDVSVLTFHSVEQLFPTRRVEREGAVWALPRAETKPNFTYEFKGHVYQAEDSLDRTYVNALVIAKHGKIVYETYRNQTDAATHFISFSMAKSLTSLLVGIALGEGAIRSLDDEITRYVPELKNTAYDGVTIRQALQMKSGADYTEVYVPNHPHLLETAFERAFVEQNSHFVDFARTMTRAYPPGEHFSYSTFETCVLGWVVERATKKNLSTYFSEKLWKPAGMESYGLWMVDGRDGAGHEFAGGGFNAVARDYLRIGLLMLNGGRAQGKQLVPADWVKDSTQPLSRPIADPSEPDFSYANQWWGLVGSRAFMARGLQGQGIFIDPDTDTVVVRLGYFPRGPTEAFAETMEFLKAASRWQP